MYIDWQAGTTFFILWVRVRQPYAGVNYIPPSGTTDLASALQANNNKANFPVVNVIGKATFLR
jgi:hypothetical protein